MATILGPRPEASSIRFDSECFETIGYEAEYIVLQSAIRSGPAVFSSLEEAELFASKVGRTVTVNKKPIRRRVRWF